MRTGKDIRGLKPGRESSVLVLMSNEGLDTTSSFMCLPCLLYRSRLVRNLWIPLIFQSSVVGAKCDLHGRSKLLLGWLT